MKGESTDEMKIDGSADIGQEQIEEYLALCKKIRKEENKNIIHRSLVALVQQENAYVPEYAPDSSEKEI